MSVADAFALVKRLLILACLLLVMWLGVCINPVFAQTERAPSRPKLGLVLSGGGAMGMAHVGAIQTLEKLGIRPDLVVGTSMGSIVGGLYASGMSGEELEHAIETMNWDLVFDTSPPREGLTYREKQLQANFPVKTSVGVTGARLRRPDALISDANLLLELRRLVRVRAAVPTFDDLPIPFRAVATDIETGKRVVLDRGELAGAMRASMSVPGVFAPYSLDGRLLVDGGMSDNVPIDVAREMGADVVIVVATQTPMLPAEQLRSLGGILGQTVTLLILANERAQLATLKPGDVLIQVDTSPLGSADFKRGPELIAIGKAASEKQLGGLQRIAALRPATAAVSIDKPPPTIDYVRVDNDSRLSDQILLRRIEPMVGKPLAPDEVGVAMRDIYAMGMFSRVDYRIEQGADGRTGLVVNAVQRPGDANRLRPGVTIAASSEGGTEFDLSAELRLVQLDSFGSEARFVGALGERQLFSAEYFKVLDSYQRWFLDSMISLQKRPVRVYDSTGFQLGKYDAAYGLASVALGRQFGTIGEVRLGIEAGAGEASLQEGDVAPRDFDIDLGKVYLAAGADSLDNPFFPNRGMSGRLQWDVGLEALGNANDYQTLRLDGLYAASFGRHAFIANLSGGDTMQGDLPLAALFTLGGPFSLPGYSVDELTGESFAALRGMYRYRLTDSSRSLLSLPIFAGATLVAGNAWAGNPKFDDLRVGANVFLAADTPIGPVFFSIAATDDGRSALYFFVGKPF